MNYISHYYTSLHQSENERVGNLLPDIFPKFSYDRNKTILQLDKSNWTQDDKEIWKGIENHYRVDAIFHALPSFERTTKLIMKKMEESPNLKPIERKYAVAHVLYELILDQMLILAHPELVDHLYNDTQSLNSDRLTHFIHHLTFSHDKIEHYQKAYSNFNSHQFLYYYAEDARLVKALYYVTGKIGNWEYSEKVLKDFEKIIVEIRKEINLKELFENFVS